MRGNHSQSQKKVYDTLGGREERTGLLPNSYNIALLSASSNMNRNVVYTELVSFLAKASADLNQQQNLKRKNCLVILNDSLLKMSIMSDSELKQSLYPERLWDWYKKTFDQIKSFGVKIVKRLRSSQSEEFLVRKSFVTDPCRE